MRDSSPLEWQKTAGFAFLPATDGLWRRTPTPFVERYAVLGVPLEFATNAPALAEMAEEAFGAWGAPSPHEPAPLLRLHAFLHGVDEALSEDRACVPVCRGQGDYLFLTHGQSLCFVDRAAGFAAAFVTPALLHDRELVQALFLETMSSYLVSRHRPATLHAAGVVLEERCVLLTGSNGAGKSTLAYACLRAGFGLLTEDVVFAEENDGQVVAWGHPWKMHLLPDAVHLFPELAAAQAIRLLNGETKLRVKVEAVRPGAAVTHGRVCGVLSLNQTGERESRLEPADPARVRHALTHFKDEPPLDRAAMQSAVDRLLAGRCAHFEVGTDLKGAADLIRRWMKTPYPL